MSPRNREVFPAIATPVKIVSALKDVLIPAQKRNASVGIPLIADILVEVVQGGGGLDALIDPVRHPHGAGRLARGEATNAADVTGLPLIRAPQEAPVGAAPRLRDLVAEEAQRLGRCHRSNQSQAAPVALWKPVIRTPLQVPK